MRGFKIYIGVMLFIIALATGILAAGAVWLAVNFRDTSAKVDSFNKQAESINSTLKDIRSELQTEPSGLPAALR